MDASTLPSDLDQWLTAFRHQLRFYRRTWRFVGLLIFVLIIAVAFITVTVVRDLPGASAADYLNGAISSIGTFGVIIGAFIGGDAIAMDFGSGSGFYLLVLPVRRFTLLLGRYAAAVVVTVALLIVFFIVPIAGALHFYGVTGLPWAALGASFGLSILYALAVISTAFFFSSLFRSPAVSMVVTILALFLGFSIGDSIAQSLNVEPWWSVLYAGNAIGQPLIPLPHHTVIHTPIGMRVITTSMFEPSIGEGVVILVAYFVVFLLLSAFIYDRREAKG